MRVEIGEHTRATVSPLMNETLETIRHPKSVTLYTVRNMTVSETRLFHRARRGFVENESGKVVKGFTAATLVN